MFKEAISEASRDTEAVEVSTLLEAITKQLYSSICNGLFERHKLIYSFLICSSIKREAKQINETHWSLILRGAGIFTKTDQPNKPEKLNFISDSDWDIIYSL